MPHLSRYPRPSVAVDLALLTVRPTTDKPGGELVTLVQSRTESPVGDVLPGRFIRERETIQQTVQAILIDKVGLSPSLSQANPRLLRVFDDPDRDERGWVISIGHMVAGPWQYVAEAAGEWVRVDRRGTAGRRRLLFDHRTILRDAVTDMRERYETDPDPDRLLRGPFTLLELRRLHEAVLDKPILKDTFNRRMRDLLNETDDAPESRPVGRPAQRYRHRRSRG